MTQTSFNILYHAVCQNIRRVDSELSRLELEAKKACRKRLVNIQKREHFLLTEELPRLKRQAHNLRQANYSMFLSFC